VTYLIPPNIPGTIVCTDGVSLPAPRIYTITGPGTIWAWPGEIFVVSLERAIRNTADTRVSYVAIWTKELTVAVYIDRT
jgi:hypothetical protein